MKFVMVPGGWQGGWVFDSVGADLRRAGHHVEAVTLAGLELDGQADASRPPNLDDHIQQVAEVIERSNETPVALCGHSYAGLVIAGVADRLDPRARPHPLASFVQSIKLQGNKRPLNRTYISGGAWPGSPFTSLIERLRNDPAWQVHEISVGHNIARRDPQSLAAVLNQLT